MKLLFVLTYYTPHWTGLTEHARRLAEGLVDRGYSVRVIATQHDASLPLVETIRGVQVIRCPVWFRLSRTLVSPSFVFKSWSLINDADCVIVYTPLAEVVLIIAMAKIQKKKMIIIHNGDLILPKGAINRMIELIFDYSSRIAGILADRLIAYSDDYAKHSRFLSRFLHKTTAILSLFPQDDRQRRKTLALPKGKTPIIGFAGRFVEEKGFDILIKSIPFVLKKYPNALFVFSGETRMSYERFYERMLPLIERFRPYLLFLGKRSQEEMPSFYTSLDVFVLPSRSDCLAFVQVEAMLAGVPVVATDIPGARVPVKETGMGVLVKPEDPEDLARGICEVVRNPSRYKKNKDKVLSMFDYAKTLDKYEKLIQEVAR